MLNDFTLARAVIGLFRYTRGYLKGKGDASRPRLVIAHDMRFFSRHFSELAASIWVRLGGEAFIFDGPRPTPQLSFSVRLAQGPRRRGHHREPQSPPRQRLQGLLCRRRAGRPARTTRGSWPR